MQKDGHLRGADVSGERCLGEAVVVVVSWRLNLKMGPKPLRDCLRSERGASRELSEWRTPFR